MYFLQLGVKKDRDGFSFFISFSIAGSPGGARTQKEFFLVRLFVYAGLKKNSFCVRRPISDRRTKKPILLGVQYTPKHCLFNPQLQKGHFVLNLLLKKWLGS